MFAKDGFAGTESDTYEATVGCGRAQVGATTTIIVHGANVGYSELSDGDEPKGHNLLGVCRGLETKGPRPMVIGDARVGREIDDPGQREALIGQQAIRQAPSGTYADCSALAAAEQQSFRTRDSRDTEINRPRSRSDKCH